jgi:hypothetical protein
MTTLTTPTRNERAMTTRGPAFAADDYVVRYGMRGVLAALLGLAVWTALAVIVVAARAALPDIPTAVALAMGEIGLLAACGVELHRAAQREVLFAVHSDGVYFGSGPVREDVAWDRISAVELFTEPGPGRRGRRAYRCVGVRVRDAAGRRDGGMRDSGMRHGGMRGGVVRDAGMRDAGMPDAGMRDAGMRDARMRGSVARDAGMLEAGIRDAGKRDAGKRDAGKRDRRTRSGGTSGDETVRFAYRRMIGWRADRARLTEVVRCYAPSVPVREGTGWPPATSRAQPRRPGS